MLIFDPENLKGMLTDLPEDILFNVFSWLPVHSAYRFKQSCHRLHAVLEQPYPTAKLLMNLYGSPLVLFHAYTDHNAVFTAGVAKLLYAMGAGLPRFFIQTVIQDAPTGCSIGPRRPNDTSKKISAGLYAFIVQMGHEKYKDKVDFFGSDQAIVKKLVQNTSDESWATKMEELICEYGFVPLQSPRQPEITFAVSKLRPELFDILIKQNGLQITDGVNLGVMRRVLSTSFTIDGLSFYLSRGFKLVPQVTKVGLRRCDLNALSALRHFIPDEDLRILGKEVLRESFGCEFDFSAILVMFLIRNFDLKEDDVGQALLTNDTIVDAEHNFGVRTRCFHQTNPGQAWRWVLRTYGTTHMFTTACFYDSIIRISMNDNSCLDFTAAGVQLSPDFIPVIMKVSEGVKANQALLLDQLREHFGKQIWEGVRKMGAFEKVSWLNVLREWSGNEGVVAVRSSKWGQSAPESPRQFWIDDMRRLLGVVELRSRKQ
ncbi:hypothetical protein BC829DRAFT_83393 [Chytridium lagenaria]|nr:hypothetical protein BC829DRAFT_83393 [Chytridium lagenaria]